MSDGRSEYSNYVLRSRFRRTGALSGASASGASSTFSPVDNQHVNKLGRKYPKVWLFFLDFKRRIPRGLHFSILFVLWLVLCCTWVLPVTFTYKSAAETALEQQLCFNWHTNQTRLDGPVADWYLDPNNPSSPPYDSSLAYRGESWCASPSQPVSLDSVTVSVDFQQLDINSKFNTAIKGLASSNRKVQWLPVLDGVNRDHLDILHHFDPAAEAYWRANMPSLDSLAIIADIYPSGAINPVEGKLGLLMQIQTAFSYPGQLPTLYRDPNGNHSAAITEHFVIKWTVTCNGQTITFSSNAGMTGNMRLDCTSATVPLQGASPSMYPFDAYQFPIALQAQAQVTSLKNTNWSIQTAVPYMQTLFSTTPSFEFTRVEDQQTLFAYSWWEEGAAYIFPITYNYLIPNQLQVLTVYQMKRSTIIKTWAMFLVVMMWVVSTCQFVLTLDHVVFRPRDVSWGLGMSALSLVWTLPSIRNSQPGIPSIGIVMDVGSFFWCELMAITAAAILIAAQFSSYQFGKERRKKKEAEYAAREAAYKKLIEEEAKTLEKMNKEAEERAQDKELRLRATSSVVDMNRPLIGVAQDGGKAPPLQARVTPAPPASAPAAPVPAAPVPAAAPAAAMLATVTVESAPS